MKFIITLLICAFALSMSAQSTAEVVNNKQYYLYSAHDTISTSSSAHTLAITAAERLFKNQDCSCSITADSLSGGTTAIATIQGSSDPDGVEWQTVGTAVTIDGVETKSGQTFQNYYTKLRVNVVAGSSTQSTRVRVEFACKNRF